VWHRLLPLLHAKEEMQPLWILTFLKSDSMPYY
jgi:hypothetical protein